MKQKRPILSAGVLAVALMCVASIATAATLSWTLPTTRENGEALAASEITAIRVYRDGNAIAALPGSATSYGMSSCTAGTYSVTAIASGLEGARSNTADVAIDQVGCRPKSPGGVAVH